MRRGLSPLLLILVGALAACVKPANGPAPASNASPSAAPSPGPTVAAVYSGTLDIEGQVFNLGCKVEVPVKGSLLVTVELDDTPTIEATGSRSFGPPCFTHTDELSHKGKLTKIAQGQYRYQRDSKNDTLEILVTGTPGADTVTVSYDNAHHCCGKPGEGNEGPQSGSAVLRAAK